MWSGGEVVYLVRSWPRLSQTFVLDEVLGLERLDVRVRVVALTAPDEALVQPEAAAVRTPVHYLGRGSASGALGSVLSHARIAVAAPTRYLRAVWYTARHPQSDDGYHVATRWQCLTLAAELATLLVRWSDGPPPRRIHLHAHFAHDPAAVAFLASALRGVSWSFTGHARDVWQVPEPVLAERMTSARFAITCTGDVTEHLRSAAPPSAHDRVRLIHHGVDVVAFSPDEDRPADQRAGHIMSVGRLVEKKGFDDLLSALGLVRDRGIPFRCTIYGEGPLEDELVARTDELGLTSVVCLAGPRTRSELRDAMRGSDLFALTPYVAPDGDRDGIPNVVVEAMACGLPVVVTATGGIPEIVRDGENGLVAPARDVATIAGHLASALTDDGLRARLGTAARRTTVEEFDQRQGAAALATMFAEAVAP